MSELRKETIEELQAIIRNEYGRVLNLAETSEIARGLVGYFDALARIKHKGNKNNHEQKLQRDK